MGRSVLSWDDVKSNQSFNQQSNTLTITPTYSSRPENLIESLAQINATLRRIAHALEAANTQQRGGNELNQESVLPESMVQTIRGFAKTIPVHSDSVVLMILAVAASILGRRHSIHVFNGYFEKFILQICLLVTAGGRKSAVLDAVSNPLEEMDNEARQECRRRRATEPDNKEIPNPRERIQQEATPEGLVTKASKEENSNGFLRKIDELPTLFKGLDQYNSGAGLEQELKLWDGSTIKQARAGLNGDRIAYKPRISTISTCQPKRMTELMDGLGGLQDSANGLWGRWLFIRPPFVGTKVYRGNDGAELVEKFQQQLDRLYRELDLMPETKWTPTHEARERLYDINDSLTEKASNAKNSFMENAFMKAIGHTARIAGVLSAIREACRNLYYSAEEIDNSITLREVEAAEHIMDYFMTQYESLAAENTDKKSLSSKAKYGDQIKALAAWSTRKSAGFTITAREVSRASVKGFEDLSAEQIREVLQEAAKVSPELYNLEIKGGKYVLVLKSVG